MHINWSRVLLCGLLAGLVVNIFESVVNGWLLSEQWADAMRALNKSPDMGAGPMVIFWLWGFAAGIYAMWLYATLRATEGPGPRTAIIAAIAAWVPIALMSMMVPAALHLFRYRLLAVGLVMGLVELVAGTLLGAWLYKHQEDRLPASSMAGSR